MALPTYDSLTKPEPPPSYFSNIDFRGRLLCKKELERPDTPAVRRHWKCIEAVLRGTKLILYLVSKDLSSSINSSPRRGRSYTLQCGDAGLAVDYKQRSDAFRLRVEGEQLLFIAPDMESAVAWVEALLAAIRISDPLDERRMPKYPALPSRGSKMLNSNEKASFRQRLWEELSWQKRQRQEWLLEAPKRSRKERWREVMRGKEQPWTRSASISTSRSGSQTLSMMTSRTSSSSSMSDSAASRSQCPCSACWRLGNDIGSCRSISTGEGEALAKGGQLSTSTSALDYSYRCTRVLGRWTEWKGGCYVKSGYRFKIA